MALIYNAQTRLRIARERGIIVDDQDKWLLATYTWSIHSTGYPVSWLYANRKQTIIYLHHCIIGQAINRSYEVCHHNDDRLDNRRANLTILTRHASKQRNSNVREAKHVFYSPRVRHWIVKAVRNGVTYIRHNIKTKEEAHAIHQEWLTLYEQHGDETWMKLSSGWHTARRPPQQRKSLRPRQRTSLT